MFLFGFGRIFIITQMHGLGLKTWMKWSFLALYVAGVAVVYSMTGVSHLWQVSAIPLIDYPAVIVLALILGGIIYTTGWRRRTTPTYLPTSI